MIDFASITYLPETKSKFTSNFVIRLQMPLLCQWSLKKLRNEKSNEKAALHNLGCKVNAYETEAMQQILEKAGYEIVPFTESGCLCDQYLFRNQYGRP